MVHRVDGPIGVYRGFDDGTDDLIAELNAELADATILQSRFSLEKHVELGFALREPVVIPNAVDPAIFHPPAGREPLEGRRVRVIATSWSDNPRKGGATLGWLDRNLDHARFELTFAGRRAGDVRARPRRRPTRLARRSPTLMRTQDAYLAPSYDDPCSNALLEALACGLPAAYRAERRASGARRRGRAAVRRGRGARRGARTARGRTGRAACRDLGRIRSRRSPSATSTSSACAGPPRIPRPWRTTSDEASAASAIGSASGSTEPRSPAPTTCSTSPTPGPRPRGSARRR